jgi:hypothetical protein
VIVEKIEGLPFDPPVPAKVPAVTPVPPPPTVTGTGLDGIAICVPPGKDVR